MDNVLADLNDRVLRIENAQITQIDTLDEARVELDHHDQVLEKSRRAISQVLKEIEDLGDHNRTTGNNMQSLTETVTALQAKITQLQWILFGVLSFSVGGIVLPVIYAAITQLGK